MWLSKKDENPLAGLRIWAGEQRILPELLHFSDQNFFWGLKCHDSTLLVDWLGSATID